MIKIANTRLIINMKTISNTNIFSLYCYMLGGGDITCFVATAVFF
jgi:hypothetical protein